MSWSVDARPDAPAGWDDLARAQGAFYHESAWTAALHEAFGFAPTYLTARDAAGAIGGILPLVTVRSPVGRRRLVSLPFSYAAGPVARDREADAALCAAALELARARGVRRVEIKRVGDAVAPAGGFTRAARYATYVVPTDGGERGVWKRLHASSTQRGIRRAEREGVRVDRATGVADWALMADLQADTSHRHGLPAPPHAFFTRTCRALQSQGLADLYVARTPAGEPAAAIVLWKGARSWIYAFGASRAEQLELRPVHAVLWRALRDALDAGVGFDLGRAAPEQEGLVQFKVRWGGVPVPLAYDYAPAPAGLHVGARDRGPIAWANRLWSALPPSVAARGAFLYKYLG